jgi:phage terminase small subunit
MTKPIILKSKKATAPAYLSKEMQAFYLETRENYRLEEHHLEMLSSACQLLDRAAQARQRLEEDGPFTLDRWGQTKPHPALNVERDSLLTASRILDRLSLDLDPPLPTGRPPGD